MLPLVGLPGPGQWTPPGHGHQRGLTFASYPPTGGATGDLCPYTSRLLLYLNLFFLPPFPLLFAFPYHFRSWHLTPSTCVDEHHLATSFLPTYRRLLLDANITKGSAGITPTVLRFALHLVADGAESQRFVKDYYNLHRTNRLCDSQHICTPEIATESQHAFQLLPAAKRARRRAPNGTPTSQI